MLSASVDDSTFAFSGGSRARTVRPHRGGGWGRQPYVFAQILMKNQ